jgi:hypothetical protein
MAELGRTQTRARELFVGLQGSQANRLAGLAPLQSMTHAHPPLSVSLDKAHKGGPPFTASASRSCRDLTRLPARCLSVPQLTRSLAPSLCLPCELPFVSRFRQRLEEGLAVSCGTWGWQ